MKKTLILIILAFIALFAVAPPLPTNAQQTSPIAEPSLTTPPASRAGRRIVITPRPLLYRRCIDWYELQHRPSGTVLYPQIRCWWVRG
jgi:hypothetical protein